MLRRLGVLLAVITFVSCISACGGSSGKASGSTTSTTNGGTGSTTSTTNPYPQGQLVAPPSTPTTKPGEGNNHDIPITQDQGSGNTILIESSGFWPETLYANDQVAVTWINLSSVPQKVVFDHIPVSSQTIPPHWSFVWKPNFGGSNTYHSASGFHGLLVLQYPTPLTTPTSS
jgi:hypothetical protein